MIDSRNGDTKNIFPMYVTKDSTSNKKGKSVFYTIIQGKKKEGEEGKEGEDKVILLKSNLSSQY